MPPSPHTPTSASTPAPTSTTPVPAADALSPHFTARIVPIIVIDDAHAAPPLADALLGAGLTCVEVTLRTAGALAALRILAGVPGLTVGAGTVLDPDQVDHSVDAGARFVVSPGLDLDVVERCRRLGVAALPGTATPSEVLRARRYGLRAVKFFPAEQVGGLPALTSMAAAIPDMRFVPTGGIGPDDARRYLASPAVMAVGGTWIAPRDILAAGDWESVRERCELAVRIVAEAPAT